MPKRGGSKGRKKPTLTSISRAQTIDDLEKLIAECANGSDHTAAILAASLLHHTMNETILHKLKVNEKEERKIECLYDRNGPLSSLFSTSALCYAMGLITDDVLDDINIIRRTRNAFAHAPRILDFTHPLVVRECSSLKSRSIKHSDMRSQYLTTVYSIIVKLLPHRIGKLRFRLIECERWLENKQASLKER